MDFSEKKLNCSVFAVITAAGLSSRMGAYKPLLPFGGKTVSACCIESLRAAGVGEIVVVTGYRGKELRKELQPYAVRFAENPGYAANQMFDSVCIGLRALPEACGRIVILPIDMPAILPETVKKLLDTDALAVRPVCHGKSGHPLVLDAGLVPRILSYSGADGLRGALEHLQITVTGIAVEDEGTHMDADTPEDYTQLLRMQQQRLRTIYLFRHGMPLFPDGKRCCLGITPDLPLSEEGYAQAAEWQRFLKDSGVKEIYTSPALRCRETASSMSDGQIPIHIEADFHELNYGEWEGMTFDDIREQYAELYALRGADMSLMPPHGETVEDAGERAYAALRKLMSTTTGDVAIVAHAGFNRALLRRVSAIPLQEIGRYRQDYACLNTLNYDGIRFSIQSVNVFLHERSNE